MTRICPECNTENEDDVTFCRNCGINLLDVNETDLSGYGNSGITQNQWAQKLFFWQDRRTLEYRLAKSKIISEAVFLIGFIYGMFFYIFIYDVEFNFILAIIASIILGMIFSLPFFAIGFLIHYLIGR